MSAQRHLDAAFLIEAPPDTHEELAKRALARAGIFGYKDLELETVGYSVVTRDYELIVADEHPTDYHVAVQKVKVKYIADVTCNIVSLAGRRAQKHN